MFEVNVNINYNACTYGGVRDSGLQFVGSMSKWVKIGNPEKFGNKFERALRIQYARPEA